MKDFGYCIWYMLEPNHEWEKLTHGFPCHITLHKNLSFPQAVKHYHNITPADSTFTLKSQTISHDDGFHSLYYTLDCDNPSYWIPKDPHVSFKYSYDEFLQCEKEPFVKTAKFCKIALVNCTGHYDDWKIIDVK